MGEQLSQIRMCFQIKLKGAKLKKKFYLLINCEVFLLLSIHIEVVLLMGYFYKESLNRFENT